MQNKKRLNLHILFDDSPLHSAHAYRGIGAYTRELIRALRKKSSLQISLASEHVANTATQAVDIIHYPHFDLFFPTLSLSTCLKKKVVVTIHDVIPLLYPDRYKPGIRGRINFIRQLLSLHFVTAVITVSECSKRDIVRKLRVPAHKVFVAYNGNNTQITQQKPKYIVQVKKELSLPEKYLLYVGDINYNKNIPQLIKMMKFLPEEYHLICVGKQFVEQDIPEWRWIEAQVAMSDITERVTFITDLPVTEPVRLSALYAGAVAYVQPSLYEGFGLPVIESMSCLCPVVSSTGGSLPEIAGTHAVYAEPVAEELAAKVLEVVGWSVLVRKQKTVAAQKWAKRYTWERTASATTKVYKSLVTRT
jgi:glycosyltransferase involved in cell wall biosynthesis